MTHRFSAALGLPFKLATLGLPFMLGACADDAAEPGPQDVVLTFQAMVSDTAAACGTTYTELGTTAAEAQLADARMFISELQVRDADGAWTDVTLDDSIWQNAGVALLDFEDATAGCADSGTPEMNDVVTGTVPAGDYDAVRYRVGLPFALNHVDAGNALPPFNVPGMFWVWQGGFKFVRVDWAVTGGEIARWNVHIGSTGCDSSAPTEAPSAACARPNTGVLELDGVELNDGAASIQIDLAALVAGADLMANTADTAPGCMSGPTEPAECGPVFAAVGMDFEAGGCDGECAAQAVFMPAAMAQ